MDPDDPIEGPDDGEDREDAEGLGDEESPAPLDAEEREGVESDLEDLSSMRAVFEGQGARGVVIACTDCGSNHYYDWDLLRESLEHMLETGEPRMHEPAYEPRESDYVLWDYGKGYVDALADAGINDGTAVTLAECPWCETPLETTFTYCPRCGRPLAIVRLFRELLSRGIEEHEARTLLIKAGFEPFS
jgi:uncharacterized protein DUF5319